jgi:hypothetical protein
MKMKRGDLRLKKGMVYTRTGATYCEVSSRQKPWRVKLLNVAVDQAGALNRVVCVVMPRDPLLYEVSPSGRIVARSPEDRRRWATGDTREKADG